MSEYELITQDVVNRLFSEKTGKRNKNGEIYNRNIANGNVSDLITELAYLSGDAD